MCSFRYVSDISGDIDVLYHPKTVQFYTYYNNFRIGGKDYNILVPLGLSNLRIHQGVTDLFLAIQIISAFWLCYMFDFTNSHFTNLLFDWPISIHPWVWLFYCSDSWWGNQGIGKLHVWENE